MGSLEALERERQREYRRRRCTVVASFFRVWSGDGNDEFHCPTISIKIVQNQSEIYVVHPKEKTLVLDCDVQCQLAKLPFGLTMK